MRFPSVDDRPNTLHYSAVKTEEGNAAARFFGLPEAYTTVEDSINGLVAKV